MRQISIAKIGFGLAGPLLADGLLKTHSVIDEAPDGAVSTDWSVSTDVHELNVPAPVWRALDLNGLAAINRAAGKILKVAGKILNRTKANGILPIELLHYGIFGLQSRFASSFRAGDQ